MRVLKNNIGLFIPPEVVEKYKKIAIDLVRVSGSEATDYLNMSNLEYLQLIPKDYFTQICENIKKSTTIKTLDMSWSNVGELSSEQFSQLINAIQRNQSLEKVSYVSSKLRQLKQENWDQFVQSITQNGGILEANIQYNELDHLKEIDPFYIGVNQIEFMLKIRNDNKYAQNHQ